MKVFVDLVWLGNLPSFFRPCAVPSCLLLHLQKNPYDECYPAGTLSDSSVWYAVAFSAAVLVTSFTTSFTNSWMISNMKAGFTVKQLRDAAAAQVSNAR